MDHPASWRHPRILSLLLLVFLAGGVAGALTLKTAMWYRASGRPHPPPSMETLRKELNLTPSQVELLETTLDDYHKYMQQLQQQMHDTMAHGKDNIRKILTPEQREKYDRLSYDLKKSGK